MDDRSNHQAWEAIAADHRSTLPLDFAPLLRSAAPEGPILEIGCGYGRVIAYLIDAGFRSCAGIDISPTMAARARASGARHVAIASADRLPFESATFAAVVAVGALSSLTASERPGAMREAARVLVPGGALFVRDFSLTLHGWRLVRYLWHYPRLRTFGDFRDRSGITFHHFRARELTNLAGSAGFQVLLTERRTFTTMHGRPSNGFTQLAKKMSSPA